MGGAESRMRCSEVHQVDDCRRRTHGASIVVHFGGVLGQTVLNAACDCRALIAEGLVRYTLLDVVGFPGKNHERLVLRLPAETSYGAVICRWC